jgi:hypothetical protein
MQPQFPTTNLLVNHHLVRHNPPFPLRKANNLFPKSVETPLHYQTHLKRQGSNKQVVFVAEDLSTYGRISNELAFQIRYGKSRLKKRIFTEQGRKVK